ncbi:MAG TPA: hypothetical protein VN323_06645 [Candidatus Dormibacteraeota bacterium]|jgi:hypothetical protein|nr:hypothetical protein [Candidatus Dormibacteraeota bacterium]
MRVRPLVLILFWGTAFIWVGYNGMQAVSSYFQTNDVAEQAFRDASERQRQRNPGELFSSDFIADLRAGVLTGARRAGLEVDPASLKVAAEAGLVRVTVSWTYRTWPLTTWGWDTGVPVPLWLGRSFDPQLGTHRFF